EKQTKLAFRCLSTSSEFYSGLDRLGGDGMLRSPGERGAINDAVRQFYEDRLDANGLFELMQPFLDTRYVFGGLELLNQVISPMIYATQDYDSSIGGQYADFVVQTRKAVDEGRREHYGEEDDEEVG